MFVITVSHQNWIEGVFGLDPDAGSGALEWALGVGLTLMAIAAIAMMRYEWSRSKRAPRSLAQPPALPDDAHMPGAMNR